VCPVLQRKRLRGDPYKPGALSGVSWACARHLRDGGFGNIFSVQYKGEDTAIKVQRNTGQACVEIVFLKKITPHPCIMP
jgi:hypothetical protein